MTVAGKRRSIPHELIGAPDEFFNPNVLMFLGSLCLAVCCFCGYAFWAWPRWLVFWLHFVALYVLGTVIHDASHGSAHKIVWLNEALGHGSALLQGFVYPVFKRVHMQHHANVNDPVNDPDHYVSTGGPLWLIPVRFFYHEVFFFKRQLWRKGKYDLLEWGLSRSLVVFTFGMAIHFGYTDYLLNYWLPGAFIMGLLLGLFFDYLPHRPFLEKARWYNARVYPSAITNLLLLGQNYHLIHHLWPTVPWYKYQAAYREAKPVLEEKGCDCSLDIWRDRREIGKFLYDCVLGIRWGDNHREGAKETEVVQSDAVSPTSPK
ncbi:fatty acid desaturase [Synechococcus sp. PCC 7336]|uniref:fatty acid desaturase n=1 Tax=Synechococcus sp. PCC 7336 TaxID=195250 RepID=UPI00034573A1|nr:fatty acid desaturase [Synechococcus sp. PCC 7336]